MTIIYGMVELLASFIELYILYRVYAGIYEIQNKVKEDKWIFVLSILGTIIVRICNNTAVFSYFTILLLVLYTSITSFGLYRKSYLKCLSIASLYILCLSCFDFFVFTFFSNILNGYSTFIELITQISVWRTCLIIIVKSLWVALYWVVRKYLYIFSEKQGNLKELFIMTVAGYVSFMYLVNQTFKSFGNKTPKEWFFMIIFLVLVTFTLMLVAEIKKERIRVKISELKTELLEEKYDLISDVYNKNAKLYHDLNKHLNVLYQLVDLERIEDAKEYIKEIGEPVTALSRTVWTGVDIIDVIINSAVEKMKERGILADINVEFPQYSNLQPNDMCTVLSNLFENAIEAAQKLNNPGTISLNMRVINHFLIIKMQNKCNSIPQEFVLFPGTTKENKELHGWGLPTVKETVEKYNGKMKCVKENDTFVVTIMMMFDVSEK